MRGSSASTSPSWQRELGETALFVAKPLGSVGWALSSVGFAAASPFSSPHDPASPEPPPARRRGAVRPGLFLELPLQQSALRPAAQRGSALMSLCSGAGEAWPSPGLLVGKRHLVGWDAGGAQRDAAERDSSRRSQGRRGGQ